MITLDITYINLYINHSLVIVHTFLSGLETSGSKATNGRNTSNILTALNQDRINTMRAIVDPGKSYLAGV